MQAVLTNFRCVRRTSNEDDMLAGTVKKRT
jgi:hypothetical protein